MNLLVEISKEAERDLEGIFDYTLQRYGSDQVFNYVPSFDDSFKSLNHQPKLSRSRHELRVGLRSFVKEYHVIFYRSVEDRIRIVCILHRSQDNSKNL